MAKRGLFKMRKLNNINKKGGVPIVVLLFTFGVFVLIIMALITFNSSGSFAGKKIFTGTLFENVYTKEQIIDYAIQSSLERASKDFSGEEKEFVNLFKTEFERHKRVNSGTGESVFSPIELEQVFNQISEENIEIIFSNDREISFSAEMSINAEENGVNVTYTYLKEYKVNI